MFANQFNTFDPTPMSFSSCSSGSSYQGNEPNTPGTWHSASSTPLSSPNRHISRSTSVKLEDGISYNNLGHESMNNFCAISPTQNVLTDFQSPPTTFSADIGMEYDLRNHFGPSHGSYESNQAVPGLDMGLDTPVSCASSMTDDFVIPPQTMFPENAFDYLQASLRYSRMDFNNQFAPALELDSTFAFDTSPQGFKEFSLYNNCNDPMSPESPRSYPIRHQISDPLPNSAILHRAQLARKSVRVNSGTRGARKRHHEEKSYSVEIRLEKASTKICTWDGCGRGFKRQEHLKRHERTHLNDECHPCEFCNTKFNRYDNLKAHTKLHTREPTKSSRTNYYSRAQVVLDAMNKRSKRQLASCIKEENSRQSSTIRTRVSEC
jgi:hypothetical protein